jgi:peptide/nickel transport system ATP-binding protein
MADNEPILELDNVSITYESERGPVKAVRDVSLKIYPNTIMGLVGESGSGKSTLANGIMRLLRGNAVLSSGTIKVKGKDIYQMSRKELKQFRWNEFSMVFQSAMTALNPVLTVEAQIVDTLKAHRPKMSMREALVRARELLALVSIDPKYLKSYPHELSGGMRQRVVIAIAIALDPSFIIMDEPTTALDVVVQKSILDQIRELQKIKKFSILFISHDFSLVSEISQQVAIMYAGRLIETAQSESLKTTENHHPYTQGLMKAIPKLTAEDVSIVGIPGNPPNLIELPSGCAYHPRCEFADDLCRKVRPELAEINGRQIECHLYTAKEEVV